METARHFRDFEYWPVTVDSSSMGAVAPLVNYNAEIDLSQIFPTNSSLAKAQEEHIHNVMEQQLFSASPMSPPENLDDFTVQKILQLEHDVWVGIDTLVKLLHALNPNPNEARVTPVPTQLLGLLPRGNCQPTASSKKSIIPWPEDFQLNQYADRLEDYAAAAQGTSATVGTYSKSPFVRYDYADSDITIYPALRRAQRLSFVVWILLDNISLFESDNVGNQKQLSRQEILELPTITQRLQMAKDGLDSINDTLQAIAAQR